VAPDHPERASLEVFIAAEFARVYGATLQHFCHTLAGRRDSAGRWVAAKAGCFSNIIWTARSRAKSAHAPAGRSHAAASSKWAIWPVPMRAPRAP
jgi:hypothetical protein